MVLVFQYFHKFVSLTFGWKVFVRFLSILVGQGSDMCMRLQVFVR